METIELQPGPFQEPRDVQVRWRRSARARLVSLRIDARAAEVVITLPPRGSRKSGLALLTANARWVVGRLSALTPVLRFRDGATLPLGGVPYVIRHAPEARGGAWLAEDGAIVVAGDEAFLPRRVADFLRAEAKRRISESVSRHAPLLGRFPRAIRVKDTSSRWGSCSSDGNLAFSWRLVMAPPWVLDYVVAHELAHLAEMNHSDRFWAQVNKLTPHTDAAEAWLKKNGPALLRVG
ncbi:M48 family metallopeptidase [Acetobacteraceae bacterium H6797]|nr:M48 family metallopeptidase [Acetobacteraceae bacterium H6797]